MMFVAALAASLVQPAQPIDAGRWITTDDYPRAALAGVLSGRTAFSLLVGPDGVPRTCTVTQGSGSDELDSLTCTLVMRRGRFDPATDETGSRATALFRSAGI